MSPLNSASPLDETDDAQRLIAALEALGGDRAYLLRGLVTVLETIAPVPPQSEADDQRDALVALGVFTADELRENRREVDRGALQLGESQSWIAAAHETRSLRSIAKFLHVTEEEVRTQVKEHRLVAVEIGGELRFPTWQLNTRPVGRTLPHLAELIPALERRYDWQAMGRFFNTRQEDLMGDGRKTPHAWLEDGGDPEAVREILEGEGHLW
jgi:hypothetical protein